MLGSVPRSLPCLLVLVMGGFTCLPGQPIVAESRPVVIAQAGVFVPGRAASPDHVNALVTASNAFALDLYGQLRGGDGNLFFSPYSISTALAMTSAGRAGRPWPR